MPKPQNLKNHGRLDPPYHCIALPILFLNVLFTVHIAWHFGSNELGIHLWLILVSIALFVAAANMRVKDLVLQNRVIRLEEKLRYAALLTPKQLETAEKLTLKQIIALRFASDAELSTLIAGALAQGLTPKQIKESVVNWRADDLRV